MVTIGLVVGCRVPNPVLGPATARASTGFGSLAYQPNAVAKMCMFESLGKVT
jgi:hypothetical protein